MHSCTILGIQAFRDTRAGAKTMVSSEAGAMVSRSRRDRFRIALWLGIHWATALRNIYCCILCPIMIRIASWCVLSHHNIEKAFEKGLRLVGIRLRYKPAVNTKFLAIKFRFFWDGADQVDSPMPCTCQSAIGQVLDALLFCIGAQGGGR